MHREGAMLVMGSSNEKGNQATMALPVSFRIGDDVDFETTLNWKVVKDITNALTKEVVKFGRGKAGAVGFIRTDEGENLSVVAFERKVVKKETKKAKKKEEEKEPVTA